MPSSTHHLLNHMIAEIIKTNPSSMLDIGVGYGKYGFLAREFLESHEDRVFPEQWKLKIEGIEIFKPYVDKFIWLNQIYDKIYIGDAYNIINKLGKYDIIILGDVIEHMKKQKGEKLLRKCIRKSKKCCLLSIPLGNWLHNKVVANNPYEEHKAIWRAKELIEIGKEELGYNINSYGWKGVRGDGGIFVFRRE